MEINLAAIPTISIKNLDGTSTDITLIDLEFYVEEARSLVGGSFHDILGPNSDQMDSQVRSIRFQKYRVDLITKLSQVLVRNYKNTALTPGVCDKILEEMDKYQDALKKSIESTVGSQEPMESIPGQ
jgi:hypothetical protein